MERYILAHDLGTSGDKATLFDREGRLVASVTKAYDVNMFNGNWAEQNPEDWWRAVVEGTREIVAKVDPQSIAAISFGAQSMGCLPVDKAGRALRPSIIHCDNRAAPQAEKLRHSISASEYYTVTGNPISPIYSLEKMMWIRDNEPEVYKNTYKFINAKDYIVARLTGVIVSDATDNLGGGVLDLDSFTYSAKIFEAAGVDLDKMPDIKPSTFIAGEISQAMSRETGLAVGTPVVIGAADGCAASIGAGCVTDNTTYLYIGSSAWISRTVAARPTDSTGQMTTSVSPVPGLYFGYGTMQAAGTANKWLRDTIGEPEKRQAAQDNTSAYKLIDQLAATSQPGAGGVIFHPYLLGERCPRWNSDARAAFLGISANTTRANLLRAVLEGVAYNLRCIYDIVGGKERIKDMVFIGGGAASPLWSGILADTLGCTLRVPHYIDEATSMGAAVIGAVGCGMFKDFSQVGSFIQIEKEYTPNPANKAVYDDAFRRFNSTYARLEPEYENWKDGAV